MVDEKYLQSAVRIRRTYLKLVNNLELYKSAATSISAKLDETLEKISKVENSYVDKQMESKDALNELIKIIDDVDNEGKRLERLIDPINMEIENLIKEEQELYRQIKTTHHNLTEDQIVISVRDRLIKEGLS